jgi:hypothetical protein
MTENKHITVKNNWGYNRVFFRGIELDQSENILISFPKLFDVLKGEKIEIKRILEIGSSRGALPFVLHDLYGNHVETWSFDIAPVLIQTIHPQLCEEYDIKFIRKDCFDSIDMIKEFIQREGLTLVICDGGDKIKKFNEFCKYIKVGDIIMVHDFGIDAESYKKEIQETGIWFPETACLSQDIHESCVKYKLEDFMQEEFKTSIFGIRRKKP